MQAPIQTALLEWLATPLGELPFSRQFGDVYFSRANGLAESRHVFLQGNHLPERLTQLGSHDYFVVGETGFGTGLNFLALWQLWRQVRPDNHSRLHFVSIEKHPLTLADLRRALLIWPELAELSTQLIAQYPPPLSGVHRLIFAQERISLDLWLGDAADCLPKIHSDGAVQAWFLDGFAPSCNPELWQNDLLSQIMRLSAVGTTFASFSVAGMVQQGLRAHGLTVTRVRGFGRKRHMLTAYWPALLPDLADLKLSQAARFRPDPQQPIAVIGAGIAGLSCAYAFAQRGYQVRLIDQTAPLAGASGNPRALLMPKLTPLTHVSEHLHTLGWLSTLRWWTNWQAQNPVVEPTGGLTLSTAKNPIAFEKFDDYPSEVVQACQAAAASELSHSTLGQPALWLPDAALLNPAELAKIILAHPLITAQIGAVAALQPSAEGWQLHDAHGTQITAAQQVIVCAAIDSRSLCPQLPALNPIRGQLSWCPAPVGSPRLPLSYGGYCTPFVEDGRPQLLFGASFIRQDPQQDLRDDDHQHNAQLLAEVLPELAAALPPIGTWHGRAATRAQTRDYLPLVGAVADLPKVWTVSGLGSKGFAFAPLCAELLVAQILGEVWPVSKALGQKLSSQRN